MSATQYNIAKMKTSVVTLLVTIASLVAIAYTKPLSQNANKLSDISAMISGIMNTQSGLEKEQGETNLDNAFQLISMNV